MTYVAFHEAARAILVGRHAHFFTGITTTEHHPERIEIQWWVRVPTIRRGFHHSANPDRVLAWLRGAIRDEAAPAAPAHAHAALASCGGAPRLRRIK